MENNVEELQKCVVKQLLWLRNCHYFSNLDLTSKQAKSKKVKKVFETINSTITKQNTFFFEVCAKSKVLAEVGCELLIYDKLCKTRESSFLLGATQNELNHLLKRMDCQSLEIKTDPTMFSPEINNLPIFQGIFTAALGNSFDKCSIVKGHLEIQQKWIEKTKVVLQKMSLFTLFISLIKEEKTKLTERLQQCILDFAMSKYKMCKRVCILKCLISQMDDDAFGIGLICQEIAKFPCKRKKCFCLNLNKSLETTKIVAFSAYFKLLRMLTPSAPFNKMFDFDENLYLTTVGQAIISHHNHKFFLTHETLIKKWLTNKNSIMIRKFIDNTLIDRMSFSSHYASTISSRSNSILSLSFKDENKPQMESTRIDDSGLSLDKGSLLSEIIQYI